MLTSAAAVSQELDKYLQAAPARKPAVAATKDELFASFKQQYSVEGNPQPGHGQPRLSSSRQDNVRNLALVLSSDYGVHCGEYRSEASTAAMFPDNYALAGNVLDAANLIITIQYGNDAERVRLARAVKMATSECPNGAKGVKRFLDDFAEESEKWHQQNVDYLEQKRLADAQAAKDKAERAEAARQANAERIAAERKQHEDAIRQRTEALRSGQAQIEDFQDAMLFYNGASDGISIVVNPEAHPDGAYYGIFCVLDKVESNDVLRAKFGNHYVWITNVTGAKLQQGFWNDLRVGSSFHVVGRYNTNNEYHTLIETKTAAVLDAVYLSR